MSVIGFTWPAVLLGLLILPALPGIYVRLLRRRARVSVTFPRVDTLAVAMERRRTVWRHMPAGVFLLGIAMLMLATARPVIPLRLPADQSAIMLSIDVSGSMLSQDVESSRAVWRRRNTRRRLSSPPCRPAFVAAW